MDRFSKLNPKVTLLFFLLVIVQTLSFFNPIYLSINLVISLIYSIVLSGKRGLKSFFLFVLPLIILAGAFNMLFTDYGNTILFSIGEKLFTAEGFFYGFTQGLMLGSVILWIGCYSAVLSTDKLLSVFSKIAPSISLTLSMTLSFIPRLRKNAREISDAQSVSCKEKSKLKKAISNLSALITMTLEESLELSDSMRARGFCKNRKPYSKYRFGIRDAVVLVTIILLFLLSIIFALLYNKPFIFEPEIKIPEISAQTLISYCLLSSLPLITDFTEDMKWLYLKSKI